MANLANLIVRGISRLGNVIASSVTADRIVGTATNTEFVVGTQVSSTSAWTGASIDPELYDGKEILFYLPYASTSTDVTLNLTLGGSGSTGAKNVYYQSTTRCTTQYPQQSLVRMTYHEAFTIGGTSYEGWWTEPGRYVDVETSDANVTQTISSTSNANYRVLLSGTADNTTRTEGVRKDADFTYNPSSNTLTVGTVVGSLSGNATSATSATNDGDGHEISSTYVKTDQIGANSGVAPLNSSGEIDSTYLPSYVDDVLEYNGQANFPATGESGKIYVDTSTNLTYRWSGTQYTEISPSLALGTTSSTAFRGDYGNTAYAHATDANRLTTATSSGFYKIAATANGHVQSLTAVADSDITGTLGNTAVNRAAADESGNNIKSNYAASISISDHTITLSNKSGTSLGTVVVPDNDTHYTTGLITAGSATATANAAATGNSVYLNVLDNSTVRNSHNIVGSGSVTVDSDANGKITITGTDTNTTYGLSISDHTVSLVEGGSTTSVVVPDNNTHYTSKLVTAGSATGTANAAVTNNSVFLNMLDDNTIRNSHNIVGTGSVTVNADANGKITINGTDNNTWTAMVGATSSADGSVGYVNAVPPKDGYNTKYLRADGTWSVPPDNNTWTAMTGATSSANGTVGYVNAVPPSDGYNTKYLRADGTWSVPPNTGDTHWTTGLITAGSATATANAAVTNNSVFLNVLDNSTVRNSHNIVGSGSVTVNSDANGKITIEGTDNNNAVTQTISSTSDADYRVLFSSTADDTTRTEGARKDTDFKYNPSTNTLTVTNVAGNASTATKATQDASGNTITTYYEPKANVTSKGGASQPVYFNSGGVAVAIDHTINADVPSNAVFTDTTYTQGTGISISGTTINHSNSVTAGTAGTSSATSGSTLSVPYVTYDSEGHITSSGTHTHTVSGFLTGHQTIKQDGVTGATINRYGACSVAAGTAAKTVSVTTGTFSLEAGARVAVKFNNANTANSPTLNVNSTGAKNIFHKGVQITSGENKNLLAGTVEFIYDGTQWNLIGGSTYTVTTGTVGSASAGTNISADYITNWSAGTVPSLTITSTACDDITAWTTNTATSATVDSGIFKITTGTAASLSYTARSVGSASGWSAGTVPSLSHTTQSIPNISVSSQTVVTGVASP